MSSECPPHQDVPLRPFAGRSHPTLDLPAARSSRARASRDGELHAPVLARLRARQGGAHHGAHTIGSSASPSMQVLTTAPPPPQVNTMGRKRRKIPKLRPYTLYANIFAATGLSPANDNGLADPYVRVSLAGVTERTQTIEASLNPMWYALPRAHLRHSRAQFGAKDGTSQHACAHHGATPPPLPQGASPGRAHVRLKGLGLRLRRGRRFWPLCASGPRSK